MTLIASLERTGKGVDQERAKKRTTQKLRLEAVERLRAQRERGVLKGLAKTRLELKISEYEAQIEREAR